MKYDKQTLIDFHNAWLREMKSKGITEERGVNEHMIIYCLYVLEEQLE